MGSTKRKHHDKIGRHPKYYTSNYLLINCNPLIVIPNLACAIGLKNALLLAQCHYWICKNREANSKKHYHDGRWWTYNSIREWREENFPFFSESAIRRGFKKLERMELIETANYNLMRSDLTLWYTINYENLLNLFPDADLLMLHPETNMIINRQEYKEEFLND